MLKLLSEDLGKRPTVAVPRVFLTETTCLDLTPTITVQMTFIAIENEWLLDVLRPCSMF